MKAVKLLPRLIRAESPSGRESQVAQVLWEALEAIGLSPALDDAGNLEAVVGEGPHEVVLTGHMDVVPAGDPAEWPYPPYAGEEARGAIWGRGTVDMKGALAAMVEALEILKTRPLAGAVRFLAVVQEEVGGAGSRFAAQRLRPRAIILGEPSELKVMRGHRGRLEAEARFKGKLAHAARPLAGLNPLFPLAKFLSSLESLELPQDPVLGSATCTPTRVFSEPGAGNVVPGLAGATIDYRSVPGEETSTILARLRNFAVGGEVYLPQMERISGEAEISYPAAYPPYLLADDDPALQTALATQGLASAGVWWFTTDAPYLATTGAPVIGFGPGDPELAHTTREHLPLEALEASVTGYVNLAEALLKWATKS